MESLEAGERWGPHYSPANALGLLVAGAFFTKVVDLGSSSLKLEIWDTAGQEKYHSVCHLYFRGANAALLVYDITRKVGSPPSSPRPQATVCLLPSTGINGKEMEQVSWFMGTTTSTRGVTEPVLLTSFREPSLHHLTPEASLCFSSVSWYPPYPHSTTITGSGTLLRWQGAVTEPAHFHRPCTWCHQLMQNTEHAWW